jgi:hypothetical protein
MRTRAWVTSCETANAWTTLSATQTKLIAPNGEAFIMQLTGGPGIAMKLEPEGAFPRAVELGAKKTVYFVWL